MIRLATPGDVPDLARVVNEAFVVEAFFKIGNRTSEGEIVDLMSAGSEFLVAEIDGSIAGCVCLEYHGDRGYLGMLSIEPARQGQGLGRALIHATESRAHERGCRFMDIHIVNLREELPPYYRRHGYQECGTLPFPTPERASRPCHFIVMTKPLD